MTTDPHSVPSVDDGIRSVLHSGKEKTLDCLGKWEDRVRKHPVESVLGAVVVGCLLHRMPVRSILVAKVKLVSALAPPALLAYGAAKLCEILQKKSTRPVEVIPPDANPREY
ncbi:MAG: hypothetical protein EOP87_05185 [Verrucomicrobiaceae bacterium]|nr:MAG: hypothetical protein EOP87_05185 [Verrucomicrobiaceae bacterium]